MSLKFIEGIQPSPSDYRDYISTAYIPTDISTTSGLHGMKISSSF